MEEYLNRLLEQIQCRKARDMVEEEIRNHIMDQAHANEQAGMGQEEALREAVRDMGDPVETGLALNRVHRPCTDWQMLVLTGIISVLSILVHMGVGSRAAELGTQYGLRHGMGILAGYGVMMVFYRLDYGKIGIYAKRIALCFFLAVFLGPVVVTTQHNGATTWFSVRSLRNLSDFIYLYIPVYGALLYRYRGEGRKGVGKCILWMVCPALFLPMGSLSMKILLFFVLAAMFSVAVGKNWFAVHRKRTLALFWSGFVLFPVLGMGIAVRRNYLAAYQTERIKAFLGQESSYLDYARMTVLESVKNLRLIGGSGREIMDLPNINNEYLLNFVANYYGMAAMLLIGMLLLAVAARVIHISFGQGNPLGMMMGCGCGLFFEIVTVMDIMHGFGWLPSTRLFLPFFSPQESGLLVAYVLAGIALSVYRYQNILPKTLALPSRFL